MGPERLSVCALPSRLAQLLGFPHTGWSFLRFGCALGPPRAVLRSAASGLSPQLPPRVQRITRVSVRALLPRLALLLDFPHTGRPLLRFGYALGSPRAVLYSAATSLPAQLPPRILYVFV